MISLGFGSGLAEDPAAEAMLKAHTKWCELHQPRAWVRTTAKRHAQKYVIRDLDGVRRAVRSGWLPPAEGRDPRPQVEAQLVREQLLKVLPDRQREVMAWTFDGFEPTEIAEAMGLSPDTVRSNLRHAREN
ncbi:RNA polymerase sigma factor [Amycolatopsis magusensis]|uniref:RNA polymerase sigma factor n=1 Tax=Amycolatopsis magusensis TaxID=882444 RepID=UPI0024A9D056|nr:sigma-70 family RNA polymerase sigma factor [Amycolatopsis magusensis]MDI5975470.1 sigma-70 family RNA polymerase sigma factor [Amycolatopsis magusensis]